MSNKTIKKIINEEINRFNGKLYVFDFDETLVSDKANVYVVKPNGDRITLNHIEYKKYVKEPGDLIDISEFDTVNDPIINKPMIDLLRKLQKKAIILTARTFSPPIENFLKTLNINVPVFAVGSNDPKLISSSYNAKRKAEWLRSAINTFKLKEIEFWDDNELNLYSVKKLGDELNIKVITHYVDFSPRNK